MNKRKRSFQPNLNGHTMLTVSLVKQKTRRPLIIYQEARGPLKRTPKKKKKNLKVRTPTIQCNVNATFHIVPGWRVRGNFKATQRKEEKLGD